MLEKASIKPSCDFQNIPLLCWLLQGYFLPHLVCHQGHCTVLSGSRPKWGPFRGIFRYFHGRMERIFISHFSFSIAEQTQLWTTHRHGCMDTHTRPPTQTHTGTSFADPNEQIKCIPAPSDFLHLLPTDRIPLQAPGCYLPQRQQQTLP